MTLGEERGADSTAMRGRARAIVAALSTGEPSSDEVFTAFAELDALPPAIVREALGGWVGPGDPAALDDATLRAHGLPPRPLRLRSLAVVTDADILDLGPVAEEQLRLAGKSYDGNDLASEERLDGEMEGSFAGTLEHHVLAEAEGPRRQPLFDVLRYAGDAGAVFRAGTTEMVGMIADGRVEMSDRRAAAAIQATLDSAAEPLELAEPETEAEPIFVAADEFVAAGGDEAEEEPATTKKKPAAKKLTAAPKKPAAAKKASAAPKRATAAKKTAAAAKKTAAAPKKTAAAPKKTTAAKKTTAKKTTAKKTTAKKKA